MRKYRHRHRGCYGKDRIRDFHQGERTDHAGRGEHRERRWPGSTPTIWQPRADGCCQTRDLTAPAVGSVVWRSDGIPRKGEGNRNDRTQAHSAGHPIGGGSRVADSRSRRVTREEAGRRRDHPADRGHYLSAGPDRSGSGHRPTDGRRGREGQGPLRQLTRIPLLMAIFGLAQPGRLVSRPCCVWVPPSPHHTAGATTSGRDVGRRTFAGFAGR